MSISDHNRHGMYWLLALFLERPGTLYVCDVVRYGTVWYGMYVCTCMLLASCL